MLKSGCLNSPKFLLQSKFPEDWKLLYQPEQEPLSCPILLVAERIFSKYQFRLALSLHFFHILLFWPPSREGSWARGMFGLSQFGGSCIIWMMHSSSSLLCNSPGFQKASNSPTCCPDGKLAVTLLYPGNTPQFMKLWSTLYSRFLLIPVLTLLTCLPTAPQISP